MAKVLNHRAAQLKEWKRQGDNKRVYHPQNDFPWGKYGSKNRVNPPLP
jgi:hypothetical protein